VLVVIGVPIAAVAILLMAAVWTFPLGLLLLPLSGLPLGIAISIHQLRKEHAHEADLLRLRNQPDTRPSLEEITRQVLSDLPGPTDGEPPWVM
jgi:hypothetical protein